MCCKSTAKLNQEVKSDVSSYDPEYSEYEFGKLSAMREIAYTLEGQYQWYYMGESCKTHSPDMLLISIRILHSFLYQNEVQGDI